MKNIIAMISILSFILTNNIDYQNAPEIQKEMMSVIWKKAMDAKKMYKESQTREDIISNLASTAPREEFIVNVDLSSDLLTANPEATVYLSTDGQNSWNSAAAYPKNSPGYENTWETIINNNGGENIAWYISGAADSDPLGFDYGRIVVSQTPLNQNNTFPPPSSRYALLATDPTGEFSANQDIFDLRGTYSDNKIFMSMGIQGGCCEEDGGWLGPWYLYGVAIVNPEAENAVAYAIGYGDGGFGQLSPGLYKISGDLSTGEVSGFEKIADLDNYSTAGNYMQASIAMSQITNDADWGVWPNTFQGFIALGVTVEAGLDGFDVAITPLDDTPPGLMIMATQFQNGNDECVVQDLQFDANNQSVSINYADSDGNLPWFTKLQLCQENGNCFYQADMGAQEHTYLEGTTFSHTFAHSDNPYDNQDLLSYDGPCVLKVAFADGLYQGNQFENGIYLQNGVLSEEGGCVLGDANGDATLNVLDVVTTVNAVLCGSACYNECIDMNGDGILNVLDIVQLVTLVLDN